MALFKKHKPVQQTRNARPSQGRQPVFSYRQNRSERTDSFDRRSVPDITKPRKSLKTHLKHFPAIIAAVAIVISLLYLTTLSTDPKIDIAIENRQGVLLQPDEVYQNAAHAILSSSLFSRSKLTIDTKKVAATLQRQYPEIGHVAVVVPVVNRRPTFVVQPIRPVFILESGGETYVINAAGVAVATVEAIPEAGSQGLVTVQDQTGVQVEAGSQTLSVEQTAFITTVIEQLKAQGIPIESVTLPPASYDLHIRIGGTAYYVKFNMREDAKTQVGSYLAAKDTITPSEYVDVRVGERVYYK